MIESNFRLITLGFGYQNIRISKFVVGIHENTDRNRPIEIDLESHIASCGHVVPRFEIAFFPCSDGPMEPAVSPGRLSTHSVSIKRLNSRAKPVLTWMAEIVTLVTA